MDAYLGYLERECAAYVHLTAHSSSSILSGVSSRLLQILKDQLNHFLGGVASTHIRQKMLAKVMSDRFPSAEQSNVFTVRVPTTSEAAFDESDHLYSNCANTCCTGAFIKETMSSVLMSCHIKELVFGSSSNPFPVCNAGQGGRLASSRLRSVAFPTCLEFDACGVLTHWLSSAHGQFSQLERLVFAENAVRESQGRGGSDQDASLSLEGGSEDAKALTRLRIMEHQHPRVVLDRQKKRQATFAQAFTATGGVPASGQPDRKVLALNLLVMFRDVAPAAGYCKLTEVVLKNNVQCELYSRANFQFELLARIGFCCSNLRVLDLFGTDTWADCLVAFFFRDAFHSLHRYLFFMEDENDEESAYHPHDLAKYCQFCLDKLVQSSTTTFSTERPFTVNPIIPLVDSIYDHVVKKYPKRSNCILRNCIRVSDLIGSTRSTVYELQRSSFRANNSSRLQNVSCRRLRSGSRQNNLNYSERRRKRANEEVSVKQEDYVDLAKILESELLPSSSCVHPARDLRGRRRSSRLELQTYSVLTRGRKRLLEATKDLEDQGPSTGKASKTKSAKKSKIETPEKEAKLEAIDYISWLAGSNAVGSNLYRPDSDDEDEDEDDLAPWTHPDQISYREITGWPHLNDCVQKLEVLNIGGTNVLGEFIPFILEHAPRIKSLGQWINTMIYGLEIMRRLPGMEDKQFRNVQEFSYSSDRNYFCQPYIGFVPETAEYKNVRKEMVKQSARVAKRMTHSVRNHAPKRRQIKEDVQLMTQACPNVRKLNLVLHHKMAVLDTEGEEPWKGLLMWHNLVELDLVAMKFANVKSLLRIVGDRLEALTLEVDEEQGSGSEIVHIARTCTNLKSLRLLIGDKILFGEMTLHFGSQFFRRLERLTVEGSVHLHGFAFLWGHCRNLKFMKIGAVVSNEVTTANVLIYDVFTLLFQVNKMEHLVELHIKNLKIRSLQMGLFLLDHLPRLQRASNWLLDIYGQDLLTFKQHLKYLRLKQGLILDYKE